MARRFIAAGAILFLLGLLTGFVIPSFQNPRMGLASHLEGVMNGTFLIALGAAWCHVSLSHRLEWATLGLLVYGSYANWLFVTLAAIWGTHRLTPIAGAGFSSSPLAEQIVGGGLMSVGLTMVLGCTVLVYGLLKKQT